MAPVTSTWPKRPPGSLAGRLKSSALITCHLGNGCSITAFREGKSVDTSMGFTPLEGLVMGTRCGDLDPAVPLYLIKDLGMGPEEVDDLLNNESGLQGLCGRRDMRDIVEQARQGDEPPARPLMYLCIEFRSISAPTPRPWAAWTPSFSPRASVRTATTFAGKFYAVRIPGAGGR